MIYKSKIGLCDEVGEDLEVIDVEVDIRMVWPGEKPIYSPPPGDPGSPPEFEIVEVGLCLSSDTVSLTENQLSLMGKVGQRIIKLAYEWAEEQELDQ